MTDASDLEHGHQLAEQFVVITGGSETDSEYTYLNYQRFFGRDIKKDENFLRDGLSKSAIKIATEQF